MQNKPLISILIVAYNPGEYLRNTLKSCLDQTHQNTEILILDNNSSEDISESITGLQDYRITDRNEDRNETIFSLCETVELGNCRTVKLIKIDKNIGPYRGLNLLLEQAKGDYIAIQDHDDIWHREKLQKQVEFLESHPEYIGCGTNTIMYYEGDKKYFEYYLGKENYYTVHPSLLFRSVSIPLSRGAEERGRVVFPAFRYDTSETEYMCDAWSLKNNLCHGEKKIANIRESLTLHLIKKASGNYSYKWHKLSIANIKRVYALHPPVYATFTLLWEIQRKFWYPILNSLGLGKWISPIERIPFRMMGKKIAKMKGDEWFTEYLN